MNLAPVRKQITVHTGQQRAFEFFCRHMGVWWNPAHQVADKPFVDVVVEPWEGGRWYERDADGGECPWGRVLTWDPDNRLVLAWQLDATWSYDPDFRTEVDIRFVPQGPGTTRVELEHRGLEAFGDAADDVAAQLGSGGGWEGLLVRFADGLPSAA